MECIKKTKIICTIGPSSWDPNILTKMINEGMNVARINGAFADIPEIKRVGDLIKGLSNNVALMLDIKGHEIRLNKINEKIHIKPEQEIIIGSSINDALYPATYLELYKDLTVGQIIIIDKGATFLEVTKIEDGKIYCKVNSGEMIESGKGMNLPGAKLSNSSLTEKDIEQMKFIMEDNWDFVAGSFIRNVNDIKALRDILKDSKVKIIAKIEDQQGVDNIDSIIEASDGIMIARGDMGTELPYEKLPIIQKELIYKCNKSAKPVIISTNMLESMIEKSMPTRAEITDVANAVLDGTDAIMTSGETSNGKYPVETIITMSRIAKESEKYLVPYIIETTGLDKEKISVAITNAVFEFVLEVEQITKIVVFSKRGNTPKLLARLNLPINIIALVGDDTLKRQLNITKNVTPFVFKHDYTDRDAAVKGIIKFSLENNILKAEDKILLLGNLDYNCKGQENHTNIFEYLDVSCSLDN